MTVENTDPVFGEHHDPEGSSPIYSTKSVVPVMPPSYSARWLWWNDLGAAGIYPPPPPGPGQSNRDVAVGMLWSFTASINGVRAQNAFVGQAPIRMAVYNPFHISEISNVIVLPPGAGRSIFGASDIFCPSCPQGTHLLQISQFTDPGDTRIFALPSGGGSVELTSSFSFGARRALGQPGARVIFASEPRKNLLASDASHVVLNSGNEVVAVLRTDSATGFVSVANADAIAIDPPLDVVVLGGRQARLLGANFQNGATTIWQNDLGVRQWVPVPIRSRAQPGHVLAVTASSDGSEFFAIDEVGTRHARRRRLLRIEPDGRLQVLASERAKHQGTQSVYLSAGYDGGLLVASSHEHKHSFCFVGVEGLVTKLLSRARGHGRIGVPPKATQHGVAWGELDRGGDILSRVTAASEFHVVAIDSDRECDLDERDDDGLESCL